MSRRPSSWSKLSTTAERPTRAAGGGLHVLYLRRQRLKL
jgi:ribosomal protein L34E